MIFCNECGSVVEGGMKLCAECGVAIPTLAQPDVMPQTLVLNSTRQQSATTEVLYPRSNDPAEYYAKQPRASSHSFPQPVQQAAAVPGVSAGHRLGQNRLPLIIGVCLCMILLALIGRALFRAETVTTPHTENVNVTPTINSSPYTTSGAPAPAQTVAPRVAEDRAAQEVRDTLNGCWTVAASAHDLDAHMRYYAGTLDTYYSAHNVSADFVRNDRARAYNRYYKLNFQISNISVSILDADATRATATFNKTFYFEAIGKTLSGSVLETAWLTKFGSRWLITGERDLKVYYVNR
ncbi:MAG TPA: zinc ribbon domain-containing protein [Pyrinomonadaceae bacterium]|nr:zinc ribbon domain-containing protein [Pyrinomonadaceae bacterium]